MVVYLGFSVTVGGAEGMLKMLLFCIIPLACIWFPEELGDYTGLFLFDSITTASPPGFVWFLGWVVLLVPPFVALLWWLQGV